MALLRSITNVISLTRPINRVYNGKSSQNNKFHIIIEVICSTNAPAHKALGIADVT